MSKIEFNSEEQEVTITRKIGRGGESTVTISPEEAGLQVNLGVVSLGATTDFGGAISLGVAGQEITWGREGGTIHIGIGGFTVDVEARDCIVTETKSIFGIIVAQRSYPDPGCKPEKTPDPPDPPADPPTSGKGIDLPNTTELGWVIYDMLQKVYHDTSSTPYFTRLTVREVSDIQEKNRSQELLPFTVTSKNNIQGAPDYTITKGTRVQTWSAIYRTIDYLSKTRYIAVNSQPYPAYSWS